MRETNPSLQQVQLLLLEPIRSHTNQLLVKSMGNSLIALVGNLDSYLAKHAHHILNATVTEEACPNNLAPTTSTTAQLALGDALAVCLMEMRGFTSEDFARFEVLALQSSK